MNHHEPSGWNQNARPCVSGAAISPLRYIQRLLSRAYSQRVSCNAELGSLTSGSLELKDVPLNLRKDLLPPFLYMLNSHVSSTQENVSFAFIVHHNIPPCVSAYVRKCTYAHTQHYMYTLYTSYN